MKPTFGFDPIAAHGAGSDRQRVRGFFFGQAAEEATLDNTAQTLVDLSQSLQRVVEGDQHFRPFVGHERRVAEGLVIQWKRCRESATLLRLMPPGVVDEDAAHHSRSDGEEVRPIGPLRTRLINEFEIRLVNESSRAEGVTFVLMCKVPVRDLA